MLAWASAALPAHARAGVSGVAPRLSPASAELESTVAQLPETKRDQILPGAERRQLTVMFCDLVGSTALSARLDPEDMQNLIGAYQTAVAPVIAEFDGFIAKYMGDGILIYFGYPQAQETDAERAVLAGLAVLGVMPALNGEIGRTLGVELAVRIGIATGLVVVGETVGEGASQEQAAETLAPFVRKVIAVDGSLEMLASARTRLNRFENIEFRHGELERLPVEDGQLDAATLFLVLHHLPDPARVLAEVARTLRPGGRLLIVDLLPHDRQELQQQMGHVWLGFSEEQIDKFLGAAGLETTSFGRLPVAPSDRGPRMFTATACHPNGE